MYGWLCYSVARQTPLPSVGSGVKSSGPERRCAGHAGWRSRAGDRCRIVCLSAMSLRAFCSRRFRPRRPFSSCARSNSICGSLRHVVKYRSEISAAMDLLGCCLTFPTEALLNCAVRVLVYLGRTRQLGITYSKHAPNARRLYARADANWRSTRSTTGYCIFLGGAAIATCCQRQGCISMSTTEAELVALAACAIELIYIMQLLKFIGYECDDAVCVETDNKGAHDLCHRFSSAQHTRHIDRKLFKLREMRGAGLVTVKYLGTEENTADIFTKILDRQPFEKHRKTVLNAAANDGIPSARDKKAMGAWPRRF